MKLDLDVELLQLTHRVASLAILAVDGKADEAHRIELQRARVRLADELAARRPKLARCVYCWHEVSEAVLNRDGACDGCARDAALEHKAESRRIEAREAA